MITYVTVFIRTKRLIFYQAINLFISSADELFGPITVIRRVPGLPPQKILWTAFRLEARDWERINDIRSIISDANSLQQYFSHEKKPSLWRAIPVLEELQTAWESKRDSGRFITYETAIDNGLQKINKYYSKFDDKPVYILSLGT
jgi:hypothetical protein